MLANILIFYFYESFAGVYFSKLKIWLIFAFPKKDKAVPPGTMRNLLRDIFKRAWGMIVATGATWDAIAAEARDMQALRKRYVYPLVALAVLLSFVFNLMYAEERAFESAVLHAIITATTLFASYFAANAICLLFLQKKRPDLADRADCETVVAYSYTVILLVEMVTTIAPSLFFFKILDMFTAYLIWDGCRAIWMLKDEERGNVVLVFSIVIIFIPIVVGLLLQWMLPNL